MEGILPLARSRLQALPHRRLILRRAKMPTAVTTTEELMERVALLVDQRKRTEVVQAELNVRGVLLSPQEIRETEELDSEITTLLSNIELRNTLDKDSPADAVTPTNTAWVGRIPGDMRPDCASNRRDGPDLATAEAKARAAPPARSRLRISRTDRGHSSPPS